MKINQHQNRTILTTVLLTALATIAPRDFVRAADASTNSSAKLPDVIVLGEPQGGSPYSTSNAVTAAKMDIPLLETPQAVSVVPRALLDDQGVRKLEEALQNVSGVTVGGY